MCGICGILYLDGSPAASEEIAPMVESLLHRGPDRGDIIVDGACGLGNRQLVTLDLTDNGALPMRSYDNRRMVAFNGKIYNHPQIRRTLEREGLRYRSSSDAETLLKLYRRDGAEMVRTLRGMFAFALWDAENQYLLLARDRLGEKPLYYYHDARVLVFASEIKALLMHPAVPRESALDARAVALYMAYGYIPAPETAFKGIKALMPGQRLEAAGGRVEVNTYWSPPVPVGVETVSAAREREKSGSLQEALGEAVRQALLSDVPLGVFLSGGLDSSLITALMRRHSNANIKTFSIAFEGSPESDETRYARRVALHLRTEHTAFIVEPQAFDLLPTVVWHHDQPFADPGALPLYMLSKLARNHVKVALTGYGGDDLFAGYRRFYAQQLVRRLAMLPRSLWSSIERTLDYASDGANLIKRARRFTHGAALSPSIAYFDFLRLFDARQMAALNTDLPRNAAQEHFLAIFTGGSGDLANLLHVNMQTYLPNDLLTKSDRSSMAVSLETRAPLLDHWLVEMASTIPVNLKLKGSTPKYLLKRVAGNLLPHEIIYRPRRSFGVPLSAWLRKDAEKVRETLLSREARERGWFDTAAVERLIAAHASGKRDHGQRLWALLTLEWWHRLFIDPVVIQRP